MSHVTPNPAVLPDKPAKRGAKAIYQLLKEKGVSQNCIVLGGDSTASNIGWKGGTMAHLEKLLGHKCFWAICMLHTNELPLRHLVEKVDGPTTSKSGFSGSIGKLLQTANEMNYNP